MSLYGFFESNVKENPELISINAAPSLAYNDVYNFFLNRVSVFISRNYINLILLKSSYYFILNHLHIRRKNNHQIISSTCYSINHF